MTQLPPGHAEPDAHIVPLLAPPWQYAPKSHVSVALQTPPGHCESVTQPTKPLFVPPLHMTQFGSAVHVFHLADAQTGSTGPPMHMPLPEGTQYPPGHTEEAAHMAP